MSIKELMINLAVLAATMLLFAAGLEAYFRVFNPQSCYAFPKGIYEESMESCYRLSPGTEGKVSQPEYKVTYTINSKGLRDTEYNYEKKGRRIIALGDSFQFGHGVENDQTYTEIIERRLNSEGNPVEIINMGVPGYGTKQELELLKAEGTKYKPDAIILSFFTEDLYDNLHETCTRYVRDGYLVDNATADERTASFKTKLFLNQNLQSYCFLKNSYLRLPSIGKKYSGRVGIEGTAIEAMRKEETEQIKKAWTRTSILLAEMEETAKEINATLVIIAIPHQVQADTQLWNTVTKTYSLDPSDYEADKPALKMNEIAEKIGIKAIDLLPGLTRENNKRRLYYPIDGHLNSEGQKAAAQIAYEELKKEGII